MELVKWKIDGLFKADAQKVYEEIGDDGITPEEIVEKAKAKDTELHKCFEWNNKVAAHKYRLSQAQTIMRTLVFVSEDSENEEPVRVFQISSKENVYQPIKYFMQNPDEHEILLNRARMELAGFEKRYSGIAELNGVNDAIKAFLNK